MGRSYENDLPMRYAKRFGDIAIKKGFVSRQQVEEALAEQVLYCYFAGAGPKKLIGEILFENGFMTLPQIELVVEEISKTRNR